MKIRSASAVVWLCLATLPVRAATLIDGYTIGSGLLTPGGEAPTLAATPRWEFRPRVRPGDFVRGGDILGVVDERGACEHRIMLPPGREGEVAEISDGACGIDDPIGALRDGTPLCLSHRWPVRRARRLRK